jgi:hypothetical protein
VVILAASGPAGHDAPCPLSARELILAASCAALLAVALTWPTTPRLATAGRVDSGDGRYSVWNVAWVAHALSTNPWRVFDANIFYPHPSALAFSEANLVAGALATPAWMATKSAIVASNVAILASFTLTGFLTYLLARRFTSSVAGAAVAAIGFTGNPYALSHVPHIQLLQTYALPLVLLAMHAFVAGPSVARAAWLGVSMALAGLACGYYGVFGGLAAGLGAAWFGVAGGRARQWRYWARALLAPAVALVLIGPFFAPYLEVQEAGFVRSLDDARRYSAGWRDYLLSPMVVYRWAVPVIAPDGRWTDLLFPGIVLIVLAGLALWWARQSPDRTARSVVGYYVVLAVLSAWASLGPSAGLYTLLADTLPVFDFLRAPSRFGVLVILSLALLSAWGAAAAERLAVVGRRRVVRAGLLAAVLLQSTAGPLALVEPPPLHAVHLRLATLPHGAVAELPYFVGPVLRHRHTEYMLMSTFHWKPLLNGYSDHRPEESIVDGRALGSFPSREAWLVLKRRGARYLVMHWRDFSAADQSRLVLQTRAARRELRPIVDDTEISLFEIVAWPRQIDEPAGRE